MSNTIVMPQLGLTMTEGTVSTWLKKPGDTIEKDEIILVVATDKVDMDVESTVNGVISEIVVAEGESVPVGTVLAYLEGGDATSEERAVPAAIQPPPEAQGDAPINDTQSTSVEPGKVGNRGAVIASPRAKRRAKELGVDITTIRGSGPGGRVLEEDLISTQSNGKSVSAEPRGVDRRRQIIAERMLESVRSIPSFSIATEVNVEKLVTLYHEIQEPIRQASGHKPTYTDLLIKTIGIAIDKTPSINSKWVDGAILPRMESRIALAVATDVGVIAPSFRDPGAQSLQEIVGVRADLTNRSRGGKLTTEDLEGDAAGTLSNLGMYAVDQFEGLITPGQTFILSVGRLQNRPWAEPTLCVKPTMILTLSVDHRIADGAESAAFLEKIIEVLTNPYGTLWRDPK